VAPSLATVFRARLALDVAFAAYMREVFSETKLQDCLLYLWLDCSPFAGETWLMSKLLRVFADGVDGVLAIVWAQHLLANLVDYGGAEFLEWLTLYVDGICDDDHPAYTANLHEIKQAGDLLAKSFDVHNCMPMGLGSKSKGLFAILAAFHFALLHSSHSIQHLEQICGHIFGVCSDGGAELGTAETEEISKKAWLPAETILAEASLQVDNGDPSEWIAEDEEVVPCAEQAS
jgi:hypothetical protein